MRIKFKYDDKVSFVHENEKYVGYIIETLISFQGIFYNILLKSPDCICIKMRQEDLKRERKTKEEIRMFKELNEKK